MDGAREVVFEQQELDDAGGRDAAVAFVIHLEGARRSQHRRPLHVVHRRAHVVYLRQQEKVFDVEDPRGLVGPLELPAQPAEMPALVVRHRRVGDAREGLAGRLHRSEQLVRVADLAVITGCGGQHQADPLRCSHR